MRNYIPLYAKELGKKVTKKQAEEIALEIEDDIIDEINSAVADILGLDEESED